MNPSAVFKRGWGLFLRRLEPSFIAEERLARIKVCCLTLAALAEPDRSVYLAHLEALALSRQQPAHVGLLPSPPLAVHPASSCFTDTKS